MNKDFSWQKKILWVSLFSIAMGFLECAVVIYLRTIYFPHGFGFPLVPFDTHIALTELIREAATIIMLLSIGFIAGENPIQRFAYFIYSFAIWDIFYYIFLKIIISWPESLMTWDVLFLIPVSWTSPVIAPVIVSVSMIILALLLIIGKGKNKEVKISRIGWSLLIAGSILIILAFIWDYSSYILENNAVADIWKLRNKQEIINLAFNYIPRNFKWVLFGFGELIIIGGIGKIAIESGIIKIPHPVK
jgi:hypothetical protein